MRDYGTAAALRQAMDRLSGERPSLGELVEHLGDRAPAFLLLVLAVPAMVPTPGVPAGFLFGTLLVLVAAQMALGHEAPSVPGWIGRRRVKRSLMQMVLGKTAPLIERIERRLKVRQAGLAHRTMLRPIGVVVVAMGVLIALPIPFGNTLPALSVMVLALGLLARDGLAVAAGLGLSVLAAAVSIALIAGTYRMAGAALA